MVNPSLSNEEQELELAKKEFNSLVIFDSLLKKDDFGKEITFKNKTFIIWGINK